MSGVSSEEKTLPPSRQKLKKARQKGQVVTSREALASVSTLAVLLYLFARRHAIWHDLTQLFTVTPPQDLPFWPYLAAQARLALDLAIGLVAPVIVMVIVLVVLMGMAVSGGPLFSTHPLIPDFNKLNPAKGFKKLFGRAAWVKFLMHLIRVCAVGALLFVMLRGQIGALLPTPPCGLDCAGRVVDNILMPLLVGLTAILTLAALLDYMVSRFEFMREQRMSITELKREFKEQDGDPLMKGQLSQTRRDMVERPAGMAQATAIIRDGNRNAVAIRWVQDDMPAPLLVMRMRGAEAISRAISTRRDLRVSWDSAAVKALTGKAVGDYITDDDQITAIASHLQ
ncbi:MAG: EscU/YscU/HrcU family type III secretion system export apparatus switch protein [Paracoccus sp. (in: a-proteobacteria)]|uniref:EscU/YscU/HrcU family type III secretion system export apparatus switch protein n=1 Tax=Paracoccus sp. TaxID=267 RepID=UPI0026DF8906|nr:EscU/YscU/HrcU family type III secretion system export apparatus switch protein [Paracoccus sp. (in: a-proteobacteria)]MDO5621565.1 EscU/YscU/HrcU family type III secretion system export apparatus switch protein [Paracoccus sp. (in: a-proteobacteria)]